MRLFANLTLQKRISLLALAGLLVGLSLFSWLGIQSVNDSIEAILNERLITARMMASHMDETLSYITVQLQNVTAANTVFLSEEQITSAADSLRETFTRAGIYTQNLMLVDREGKILQMAHGSPGVIGADLSDQLAVMTALRTGLPTISNVISSPLSEVPVFLVSAPISNDTGAITGALISSIDVKRSSIGTLSQTMMVGETGYTEIVDGNGIVIARSKPGTPPALFEISDHPGRFAELISQGKATVRTCHRCHETRGEIERQKDILAFAPLSTASWGVAIRQSEEETLAPAQQLKMRLLILGIIVVAGTLLLVWAMIQGIVKPVRLLTLATKKIAAGDFDAVIPAERQDEIGELSTAFRTMTHDLAASRGELVSLNEELLALNSIAATANQSLNLNVMLKNTLQKVLEVTGATTGCVFLADSKDNKLEPVSCVGSSEIFRCRESDFPDNNCACRQVLRNGQTLIVDNFSQCPALGKNGTINGENSYFACVPLKSRERTIGVMNVVFPKNHHFAESDLRLLNSISYYMVLAIENSVLYEDAKQREKLRGQLLNRVINAQEEERKRIARELHDEYGQTLTGLILTLEMVEHATSARQTKLREKLEKARSLVLRSMDDLRRLTLDLRPTALDDLGLIPAIRAHIESYLKSAGIRVEFESTGINEDKRLAPAIEITLFRIIQEASNNVIKHAEARNVRIKLEGKGGKIKIIMEDDGKGFDVTAFYKSKIGVQSLGLLGIQERATLLGGTFNVKSKVGQGTRITVDIPLAESPKKPNVAKTGQNEVE